MITGQVSNFQERFDRGLGGDQVKVWSFRVERQGDEGEPLPRVAVEMRGKGFDGSIAEGDTVRVNRQWREGTTLQANSVDNLSTNTTVSASGAGAGNRILMTILAIVAIAIFAGVLYGFFFQR